MTLRELFTVRIPSPRAESSSSQSAHAPRAAWPILALIFLGYCLLAPIVPPFDDEFYYWCWSQRLQWSYYDHPLMSALLIRMGTLLAGDTLFAMRLPACVATVVCFSIIVTLTQPRRIAWWLLLTPLFSVGAVIVTPDTPLILFWSAYVLWLVKAHEQFAASGLISARYWAIGGVLLGCGVLGKYTMALAVPAGGLSFILMANWRKWLVGYIAHGVLAFVVASPILIHNIRHDFVPLAYQWKHSMGTNDPSLRRFAEFMGIQMLLVGTMPIVLFAWVMANARQLISEPRLRVCLCLYGFPFAFFVYKALKGPLEGNWALVSYIAFWPLAAVWYESVKSSRTWRILAPLSFLLPVLAVIGGSLHAIRPIPWLPPASDRITRQSEKLALAQQMKHEIDALPEQLPIYTDTYQWVALLRFVGLDVQQFEGISRPSHFTQIPSRPTDHSRVYLLWDGLPPERATKGLGPPTCVKIFPLRVRGTLVAGFGLWRYERLK